MANSDAVEWRLIDTDLVTVLGILPASESHLYLVLNEPGSGELKIPLGSALAGSVGSGMFAQCSYRGAVRGGFFVENISKGQADAAEGGGQWVSISGRGALSLLEDAIIWDDGTSASTRDFAGMTKAAILITLIDEAQARGALLNLSYDFTAVLDSDGVAWTDSENYKLNVGSSLLDITRQFARTGIDFDILPGTGDFVLSAYKLGKGSDKSESVYLRTGVNCEEVTSDEHGDKIKNAQLIAYKGGYISVSDAVSIAARRRREKLLDLKMAQTSSSATTIGAAEVALRKDPQKSISVKIYDGAGPRGFVDYDLGDYIMLDVQGTETRYRIYGVQPDWKGDQFSTVIVELNSILYENDIQLAQDVAWLLDQWSTANDADLIEVSYWANIGDSNITVTVVGMVLIGTKIYFVGSGTVGISSYDIATGTWEILAAGVNTPLAVTSIGTDIYIAAFHSVYKFDTLTGIQTEVGDVVLSTDSFTEAAWAITAIGTDIYIAGVFDSVDGVACDRLAKYNTLTDTWSAGFGSGITGVARVLLASGSNIYMGGTFTAVDGVAASKVAMWNGSTWTALDTGLDGTVLSLAIYGSNILAGGSFTGKIAEWDGAAWTVFGGGVNGNVEGIAIYLTDVYAVGSFTDVGNRIARYSGGSWWQLDTGLNNTCTDIVLYNEDVYVGGTFTTAGDKVVNKVAAYFNNFESLADYLENSSSSFNMGAAIHAAAASAISDSDEIPFWEDVANALRKITFANFWAAIKAKADLIYVALTGNQTIAGVKTFSSDPIIPDEAYDATTWNGSLEPPTKNAVRDKIETMGGGGTPGGSDTQVQYNNGGAFGGASGLYYDDVLGVVYIGGSGGSPATITDLIFALLANGDDNQVGQQMFAWGDSTTTYSLLSGWRSSGTKASPTALGSGKIILSVAGYAHDGVEWYQTAIARMLMQTAEAQSATNKGSEIVFQTTPIGSATRATAFTIKENGNVNIESGKTYNVNGSPHVHTAAVVAAIPNDGWVAISATGTSGTLDAPSFEISFNADMTGLIGLGDRIKITQTTTKYFIVTKVGAYAAGATVITCYGGTDYTLVSSGTTAITNPCFSHVKVPFGFPGLQSKWTVTATDTTTRTKTTPTDNAWYGETDAFDSGGLPNIDMPIGAWVVGYSVLVRGQVASASSSFVRTEATLSTSGNSVSDSDFTVVNSVNAGGDGTGTLVTVTSLKNYPKELSLTTKTTYYLLAKIDVVASPTSLQVQGLISATTIKAVCAYL